MEYKRRKDSIDSAILHLLDACEVRSTPPGKVFWVELKENSYFVCQRHKTESNPVLGMFVSKARGIWSPNTQNFRILIKSEPEYYEIVISNDERTILMAWDWIESKLMIPLKRSALSEFLKLEWLVQYFKNRVYREFEDNEVLMKSDLFEPKPLQVNFVDAAPFKIGWLAELLVEKIEGSVIQKSSRSSKSEFTAQETKEEEDKDICKICFERDIECAIVECGHTVLCLECSNGLKLCPMCREPIQKILRIYRS